MHVQVSMSRLFGVGVVKQVNCDVLCLLAGLSRTIGTFFTLFILENTNDALL